MDIVKAVAGFFGGVLTAYTLVRIATFAYYTSKWEFLKKINKTKKDN